MKYYPLFILFILLSILSSCEHLSQLTKRQIDFPIQEIQSSLIDLERQCQKNSVDIQLVEERVENQEKFSTVTHKGESALLKKDFLVLEKKLEKLQSELTHFMNDFSEMSSIIQEQRHQIDDLTVKLQEIGKLRKILSQATKSDVETKSQRYIVKSGDSLQKIARQFHISIEELKKENHLETDKIFVGQQLTIPST